MPIKLAWFNVANARNDEASEAYRFAQREQQVHAAIKASAPDVVCVLELRVCSDLGKTRSVPPEELGVRMASATGMSIAALRPQNLDHMAFWRMTMYNAEKLTHLKSSCHWAIPSVFGSTKVAERGVMFIFSQFEIRDDGGDVLKKDGHKSAQKRFWVINAHMPIAEEEKLRCVQWLNANAARICSADDAAANPLIFYGGDQNTFFDLRGNDMMTEFAKCWTHLSADAKPTFRSFPQDPVQATSTLDHIFVHNYQNVADKYKIVTPASATDTGASDHFLMSISVEIQ